MAGCRHSLAWASPGRMASAETVVRDDGAARRPLKGMGLVGVAGVLFLVVALLVVDPDLAPMGGQGRGLSGLLATLGLVGGSPLNRDEIARTNAWLEGLPPAEQPVALLRWANRTLQPSRWAQFTSFGPSGIVITDLLARLKLLNETQVVMIDTLHLFPETHELLKRARDFFGLHANGKVFRCDSADSLAEFQRQYGPRIWRAAPKVYEYVTKIEPTRRALDQLGLAAWVTGRRRSQGGVREELPLLELDSTDGRLKMNPLSNWALEDVWAHIKDNKLPYNALHDQGYTSVGDMVSTEKPDDISEGERAGRWKGSKKSECGMHLAQDAKSLNAVAQLATRVRNGYAWDEGARAQAQDAGVLTVTEDNFDEVVMKQQGSVLLMMYAPWCPHCQQYAPTYNELAAEAKAGRIKTPDHVPLRIARMDRWQNEVPKSVAAAYEMSGFPSVFLVLEACRDRPILHEEAGDVTVAWLEARLAAGCEAASASSDANGAPKQQEL